MVIPRHKVCDICGEPVGNGVRYYCIRSKAIYRNYAGSVKDNRTHHICETCMDKFVTFINNPKVDKQESS